MSRTSARVATAAPKRQDHADGGNGAVRDEVESRDVSDELRSLQLSNRERWGPSRSWIRRAFILIILAGLAAVILHDKGQRASAFLAQITQNTKAGATVKEFLTSLGGEAPGQIVTMRVEPRDRQFLSTTGFIKVPNLIHLSAEVPGTVVEVPIEEGMVVQMGDMCIRLEDARYKAELDQAKAALDGSLARLNELKAGTPAAEINQGRAKLDAARSQRESAEKTLDRETRLIGTNAKAQHERAQASLEQAIANERLAAHALESLEQGTRPEQIEVGEAEVRRTEAALVQATYNYEHAKILAPQAGTILERNVELGQFVRGGAPGESLFVIADLTQLTAVVAVSERDLSLVKTGQTCEITTEAYPDRLFHGEVDRLGAVVNRQRGIMEVIVKILDADATLLPDMNCSVSFLRNVDAEDETVIVPRRSLAGTEGDFHVFVLDENKRARKRLVQVGNSIENDGTVEVTEGLSEGELVIIADGVEFEEGQEVPTVSD